VLDMMCTPQQAISSHAVKIDFRQIWQGFFYVLRRPMALLRNSSIGVFIGFLPGLGGVTASFLSYAVEKGVSKNPGQFGKGFPGGVLAPEAANNAVQGGDALTSLLLGIPGSAEWAVLLGILTMYGFTPGPTLITEHPGVLLGVVWGLVASNFLASFVGLFAGTQLARMTTIKIFYITAVVVVTSMVGAYLIENSIWDCLIALIGGLFGYSIHKLRYGTMPFVLGFILGPLIEKMFYQTWQIGYGTPSAFFNSKVSITVIVFIVALLITGPWLRRRLVREE
jgi:putative tricarboxylic transport membrane protein